MAEQPDKKVPSILNTVQELGQTEKPEEKISMLDDDDLDEALDIVADQGEGEAQEQMQSQQETKQAEGEDKPKDEKPKDEVIENLEENLKALDLNANFAEAQKAIAGAVNELEKEAQSVAQDYELLKKKLETAELSDEDTVDIKVKLKDLERRAGEIIALRNSYTQRAQSITALQQYLSPEDIEGLDMERLVKALRDDNFPEDVIQRFKQDPLGVATPVEFIQLVRRVNAEEALRTMATAMQALKEENERLKNGQKNVVKTAAKMLNNVPLENITDSQTTTEEFSLNKPIEKMTDEELTAALRQIGSLN